MIYHLHESLSRTFLLLFIGIFISVQHSYAQEWYKIPDNVKTRWSSFENPDAEKGAGAQENKGAKGHAFDQVDAGETVTLLQEGGPGIIKRIWMTINDRSPKMLRSLRIEMYWDGYDKPAVSAPLGDFFGVGLGRRVPFESALFTDPEGRSFNSYIPMPFNKGAKITLTNDSDTDLLLLFYDINFLKLNKPQEDILYFHTFWNRSLKTELKQDFEILPAIEGYGRYMGTNIGVLTDPIYGDTWWGEGEVKIYIDGDDKYPTLVGTGTEDYIGSAWEQGTFDHDYQGSLIVDKEEGAYAFYRYHVPDPVYFRNDVKITIQQIGGGPLESVREIEKNGAPMSMITAGNAPGFVKLLEQSPVPDLHDSHYPKGWTNFYRSDDVSSTVYFYLDKPATDLPALPPAEKRTAKISNQEKEENGK